MQGVKSPATSPETAITVSSSSSTWQSLESLRTSMPCREGPAMRGLGILRDICNAACGFPVPMLADGPAHLPRPHLPAPLPFAASAPPACLDCSSMGPKSCQANTCKRLISVAKGLKCAASPRCHPRPPRGDGLSARPRATASAALRPDAPSLPPPCQESGSAGTHGPGRNK